MGRVNGFGREHKKKVFENCLTINICAQELLAALLGRIADMEDFMKKGFPFVEYIKPDPNGSVQKYKEDHESHIKSAIVEFTVLHAVITNDPLAAKIIEEPKKMPRFYLKWLIMKYID